MKLFKLFICFCIIGLGPAVAHAGIFLQDGFESADMSATSQINTQGFQWRSNNRTSVVTMNAPCSTPDTPVAVYNNGVICNVHSPRDWNNKNGNYGLRFRYPAGEPWAQQEFELGQAKKEIWIRYWLRVPVNFSHDGQNYKFFSFYMDGYSTLGTGSTVWWNMLPNSNGNSLAFNLGDGTSTGGWVWGTNPFIKVPDDRGRWMQIVIHLKTESSPGASDGLVELWRRWDGESGFTQFDSHADLPLKLPNTGVQGWWQGYILGWANPGYLQDTEWLLDDFTLSDSSLLQVDNTPPPMPPGSIQ
jgi:hypothetical protein